MQKLQAAGLVFLAFSLTACAISSPTRAPKNIYDQFVVTHSHTVRVTLNPIGSSADYTLTVYVNDAVGNPVPDQIVDVQLIDQAAPQAVSVPLQISGPNADRSAGARLSLPTGRYTFTVSVGGQLRKPINLTCQQPPCDPSTLQPLGVEQVDFVFTLP
jgi:hypothetical protein